MTWNPKAFLILVAMFSYCFIAVFLGKMGVLLMIVIPFLIFWLVFIYASICHLLDD